MRSLVSNHHLLSISPFQSEPRNYLRSNSRCKQQSGHVSDIDYLMKVIDFLKDQRELRSIQPEVLTRQSRLGKEVIELAEAKRRIPSTREFRAWSHALGFKWEDVWTLVLLPQLELSC